MPPVTKIAPRVYTYKCQCGREVEFHTDASEPDQRPERVSKCWKCLNKLMPGELK